MKGIKRLCFSVFFLMVICLDGCGDDKGRSAVSTQSAVEAVLDEKLTEELSTTYDTETITENPQLLTEDEDDYVTTDISTEITTQMPLATGPDASYEGHIAMSDEDLELTGEPDPNVDVDLTVMSSNMIYAEVYSMVMNPDKYLGKTVKIKGQYYPLYYEGTGNWYHYVMIKDALACCQNGMEFVWGDGSHVYPDEYPEENQEIEIIGTYGSYEEENYTYYYILVDGYTICE